MNKKKLIQEAKKVRNNAYAPFSTFKVGAAVLTTDGKIFTGCNVENSSYGLTVCAERIAIFKAISEGYQDFQSIAIVADTEQLTPPCGSCRQVLVEFNPNMEVILSNLDDDIQTYSLKELMPEPFIF